jgi:hypothetical protein
VPSRRIDTEIDRLYQLPPDEFTAARNALAKEAGPDRAEVRGLAKPPLAAWAVNQVYWKHRDVYDALIDAATELRKLHKAVLAGRQADIREAGRTHDAAAEAALKTALAILRDEGHPATDSTRQAIMTTLRALPGEDPPGRLTRTLQPGGFEMLSGLSISGTKAAARSFGDRAGGAAKKSPGAKAEAAAPARAPAPAPAAPTKAEQRKAAQADAAQARAAREAAARAVREAEQAVRRDQFEAARLTRDASKADRELDEARETVESAKRALERAGADALKAARQRDAAVARVKESERALEAARAATRKL